MMPPVQFLLPCGVHVQVQYCNTPLNFTQLAGRDHMHELYP